MSRGPEVRVNEVGAPRRCAFCHADLPARYRECQGCGVATHTDCLRELGRCPTEGCAKPSPPAPRVTPYPAPTTPLIEVLLCAAPGLWLYAWKGVAVVAMLLHTTLFGHQLTPFRGEPAPSSASLTAFMIAAVLLGPALAHGILAPLAARRGVKHPHRKAALAALGGAALSVLASLV
ncbi:MAG: hypothetical protein KF878_20125 [Planctomycetes bacterium]|nr:hypothetical protein [Planctomycetota bacterium]